MNPVISIIIPSLNDLKNLKSCLKSIEYQKFKNYEVIVMDGKSTDGTQEYLKTFKKPFCFISEHDKGLYDAMNKGVLKAKGEWLYFMGADDRFYDKNVLEDIFNKITIDSEKLILGLIKYDFKENSTSFLRKHNEIVKPEWSSKIWLRNTIHHQGVFYHKSLFKYNKFNNKYTVLADYAFNLKLYRENIPVKITNRFIALCGRNGLSKNFNKKLYQEEYNIKCNLTPGLLHPFFKVLTSAKYIFKNSF